MKTIKIGNKMIGDGYPAFIIAEMAWSHDGSAEKAKKIIDGAAKAKADAICFHITSMPDYMIVQYGSGRARVSAGKESRPIYDYLSDINLKEADWKELLPYAKKLGLLICAMCNDIPSVEFVSKLNPDAYVISPSTLVEEKMIKTIAEKKKPVFIRTGGAFLGEVERAVSIIKKAGNDDIALIHGFQNYPTKLDDMYLKYIQSLKQIFVAPVGFADHTDGASEMALIVPLLALPFGANLIEKHITHDRSLKGEDFELALDPKDFERFVKNLRDAEKTFGSHSLRPFSEDELNYRQVVRKRAVAAKDVKKGEKITEDNVVFKRSDEGIFPNEIQYLFGRIANKAMKKDEPITWDKVS